MFLIQIWSKMRADVQHQGEKIQDWAIYLEYLQFSIRELDVDYALGERKLGHTFYDGFRLLIKL